MNFLTYLLIQLDRIKSKPPNHASGPKKPDLAAIDNNRPK